MNHKVFGRKLHRSTKLRAQLFKVLIHNFVVNDKLTTTEGKAKAVRPLLEKLLTKAKKGESQRRLLLKKTGNKTVVNKLFKIAEQFANTPGGYTKLLKLETRLGDNSKQVLMIWSQETKDINQDSTGIKKTEGNKELKIEKKSRTKKIKK